MPYGTVPYFEELLRGTSRPILPRVLDIRPIPVIHPYIGICERASHELRGFKYRNLEKLMSSLPSDETDETLKGVRVWIRLTFVKLKIVVDSFHELESYCRLMWKNCLCLEGQEIYSEAMDDSLTSKKLPLYGTYPEDSIEDETSLYYRLKWMLKDIDPSLWLPLTAFPLWKIVKEPKLPLAFLEEPKGHEHTIRSNVREFLRKYGPRETFVPSDLASKKVGSQKFNDGGLVKRDSERPERSYQSGFLYQEFVTKPLQSRECWLPGKAIKDNNGWWFIVVDSIMRKIPYSALLKEPEEIWTEIRGSLKRQHIMFDISGYGIQFPRNYLRIGIQEIVKMYPGIQTSEHVDIAEKILDKVELQMPDGTFRYPTRGIGLGYYENLKTLIVMAIIDFANPISVYGDQAILPYNQTSKDAIKKLQEVGFLFTKEEKTYYTLSRLKWSGQIMSKPKFYEPRTTWSTIFGAFNKMFHWERKAALSGIILPDNHKHVMKRVAYQYERAFKHEFVHGESLKHPDNGGLNPHAVRTDGWTKMWKVERLTAPTIKYEQGIFVQIPYSHPAKKGEARRFDRLRSRVFKRTKPFDSSYITYVDPIIEMNAKRKPDLSPYARSMPLWAEIRNLIFDNVTTGKLASGLKGDELQLAPLFQKYAPDPFRARATGGYEILTPWRGTRGANSDFEFIANMLAQAEDEGYQMVYREDLEPVFWQTLEPGTKNPYLLDPVESRDEARRIPKELHLNPDNEIIDGIKKSFLNDYLEDDAAVDDWVERGLYFEEPEHNDAQSASMQVTRLKEMLADFVPALPEMLEHEDSDKPVFESYQDEDQDLYDFDPVYVGQEEAPTVYGWKL